MGGDKNSTCTDKHGRAGPDLGPILGEISPNIMFRRKKTKGVWTARDGYTWVRMGSHGCSGVYLHGGTGQQGETRRQRLEVRTCFACRCDHGKHKRTRSWQGWSRGSGRERECVCVCVYIHYMLVCMCVCVCACVRAYIHNKRVCAYVHCVCVCVCARARVYICDIYVCVCVCVCVCA